MTAVHGGSGVSGGSSFPLFYRQVAFVFPLFPPLLQRSHFALSFHHSFSFMADSLVFFLWAVHPLCRIINFFNLLSFLIFTTCFNPNVGNYNTSCKLLSSCFLSFVMSYVRAFIVRVCYYSLELLPLALYVSYFIRMSIFFQKNK